MPSRRQFSPWNLMRDSLSKEAEVVAKDDTCSVYVEERYKECIKRWSSAAQKPAAVFVLPACVDDIVQTLQFAVEAKMELAVKGGGHATSGSSSTDGGLCLDLSKMKEVTVDVKKKTVAAQGGALWIDVYKACEAEGLVCVGGAIDHTGIGGLTLGGGYGWLQGEHGLVIDNLLSVDFVLADGSFVTASESVNRDLFWAARGAGASFGVASSFTCQAYEQKHHIWGGELVFPISELSRVINAANEVFAHPDPKSMITMAFGAPPPAKVMAIILVIYYNGPKEQALGIFSPLFDIQALSDKTHMMPYRKINTLFNASCAPGVRRSMKGSALFFPLSIDFAKGVLNDLLDFFVEVEDAMQSVVVFEYFRYDKMAEVPQTATAFANRGCYANLLWIMGWTKEENDHRCREWTRAMSAKAKKEFERNRQMLEGADESTKSGVGEYFNYDGIGVGGEQVFGVNFPRLVALKRKFDPENLFAKGPQLL